MKKLFITAILAIITLSSYGQTFIFKGLVSPKGSFFSITEMLKDPDFYGLSTNDIRRLENWTIKLADKDGGLQIISSNLNSLISEGTFFSEDDEKDNYFIYENKDVKFDITLKTTFGYYRSFILGIYEDEAFWFFNKDTKKQFGLMFERK